MSAARAAMRTTLAVCLLAFAVATGPVRAQPVEGDHEVLGGLGFFHRDGSDRGDLNVAASYGYFVHRMVQLGIEQGLSYAFLDDQDDAWLASTLPFVNVHFRGWGERQTIVPFVGGVIGAVYNDDDAVGMLGPQAGIKFFATDHVFIAPRYRYEWFWNDFDEGGTDDDSDGNHVATINIGFLFGGDDRDDYDDRNRDRRPYAPDADVEGDRGDRNMRE
jgi:hypothetical protein